MAYKSKIQKDENPKTSPILNKQIAKAGSQAKPSNGKGSKKQEKASKGGKGKAQATGVKKSNSAPKPGQRKAHQAESKHGSTKSDSSELKPSKQQAKYPVVWGESDPQKRGPIVGTVLHPEDRNVVGTHSGPYTVYRALAVAAGQLDPLFKPNFYLTDSTVNIKYQV